MHILWVNENADFTGGCEHYIRNTAELLHARGVRNTLMYDVNAPAAPRFFDAFDAAFPCVDIPYQVREIAPDVVYIHRLHGGAPVRAFAATGRPAVRFFHDHRLFCLREHKYTTISHQPCTRPIGSCCIPCLGWINRSASWPGVSVRTLGAARRELNAQHDLTGFVVGSHYMADHVAAHGFPRQHIRVIPPYAFPPDPRGSCAREDDLFLFVGQLVRGKGLDVLLDAFARVSRPSRLIIAGAGRQEDGFREMADTLGIGNRVAFAGRLTPDALNDVYRRALCVVFPTRAETFGLVGPEAMRYATPVIASRVGGVTEWLDDGVTGIAVAGNDPQSLAGAMTSLLESPARARTMGENAARVYAERFTPETHIDALLAAFDSIAARTHDNETA